MTIVIPCFANFFMTFNTSPTISGSKAEVGSSKSMISGFIANARAIATRCFCPPDKLSGYISFLSSKPTVSNNLIAFFSASSRESFFRSIGAKTMFSNTERCGKRLKCWNTMPICCLTKLISVFLSIK